MLKEWLTADHIQLCERVEDWRQAVTLSAQPLLQRRRDHAELPDGHLSSAGEARALLCPGTGHRHAARPAGGGRQRVGIIAAEDPSGVNFHSADNDPVQVVVMLSAPDGDSHIELISQLAELFSDNQAMEALFHAKDKRQIEDIIARY